MPAAWKVDELYLFGQFYVVHMHIQTMFTIHYIVMLIAYAPLNTKIIATWQTENDKILTEFVVDEMPAAARCPGHAASE